MIFKKTKELVDLAAVFFPWFDLKKKSFGESLNLNQLFFIFQLPPQGRSMTYFVPATNGSLAASFRHVWHETVVELCEKWKMWKHVVLVDLGTASCSQWCWKYVGRLWTSILYTLWQDQPNHWAANKCWWYFYVGLVANPSNYNIGPYCWWTKILHQQGWW